MRNAGSLCEEFATTVATIAVDGNFIPACLVEGLAVAHAKDAHLLSVGLRDIHLIVNACSRVEVEGEVLESQSLLVAIGAFAEEQQMIVGRCHRVHP